MPATNQPALRKYSGIVVHVGPTSLKWVLKFQAFVVSGLRPLRKLFRLGEHTACWQYARSKTSACFEKAARCGVTVSTWPYGEI